jgi:hypothetical protein
MPQRLAAAASFALTAQFLLPAGAWAQVGSSNVAAIEPPSIAHPATTPCTVPLYQGATFGGNTVGFSYTPPAACPGP